MALGDGRIYAARGGGTHGATDLLSLTHFSVGMATVKGASSGPAGHPGLEDEQVTDRDIRVTLFFLDEGEALALVEAAAANLVLKYVGEAGANMKRTIKNVYFSDPPSDIATAAKEAGGPVARSAITGRGQWGAADTFALMNVLAADA